jgi:hypothetical protein
MALVAMLVCEPGLQKNGKRSACRLNGSLTGTPSCTGSPHRHVLGTGCCDTFCTETGSCTHMPSIFPAHQGSRGHLRQKLAVPTNMKTKKKSSPAMLASPPHAGLFFQFVDELFVSIWCTHTCVHTLPPLIVQQKIANSHMVRKEGGPSVSVAGFSVSREMHQIVCCCMQNAEDRHHLCPCIHEVKISDT